MRYALLAGFLLGISAPVSAAEWNSTGGDFSFAVTIEGVEVPGHFDRFVVKFDNEPGKPEESGLHVTVDLRAADMGDADMNTALFASDWFGVEQFAEAIFNSVNLSYSTSGEFIADGILTLKGRSESIAVPFTWMVQGDAAAMQGELTLQRTSFDVGSGEWANGDSVGIDVKLSFAIELERAK